MRNLPLNLLIEKNKLSANSPWLILLDIALTNGTTLYLVQNTEDITFQTRTYAAFPFLIEFADETSKGEIVFATLKISNVSRLVQAYIEDLNGAIGSTVKVRIVNAAYLSENYADLEMSFQVLQPVATAEWVTFKLGYPNPILTRYPFYRYIASHCNWRFKGNECAYSGTEAECKRTLDDCRARNNSARFGGYPGINDYGIKLA